MFTDDLREELESALVEGITDVDLVSETLDRIEDAIYNHGYAKVYTRDEAELEYLNYLDETYDLFEIDGRQVAASWIMRNLPGNQFNLAVTQFITKARNGIIK